MMMTVMVTELAQHGIVVLAAWPPQRLGPEVAAGSAERVVVRQRRAVHGKGRDVLPIVVCAQPRR